MENLPPAALPPPPPKHISLRKAFPALAEQYHPKRNKRKSIAVPHDSLTPLWWKCPLGPDHEWQATIAQRLAEEKKFEMRGEGGGNADASQGDKAAGPKTVGCPCCSGMKTSVTNSIATKFPAVAAMWSPPSDGLNPERVRPDNLVENSNVNVWFKCGEGPDHVWQLPLQTALKVEGALECPCCLGKKVSVTNSLKAIRPDIAEMWCTEKNFEIGLTKGPEGVLAESEGLCWVENDEGRVWEVLIRKAVKEEGLPVPPPLPPPPPPPPPPRMFASDRREDVSWKINE